MKMEDMDMTILESYIDCMQRGDEAALADLFNEYGVLHDSSLIKAGMDTLHLEGRMAVEMMFHHKFGFNGGPFPIHSVKYLDGNTVWYFITYNEHVVPVTAFLSKVDEDGKNSAAEYLSAVKIKGPELERKLFISRLRFGFYSKMTSFSSVFSTSIRE